MDDASPALFFYGTLLDDELFACVVGAPKADIDLAPAWLKDHWVTGISGLPYPMLSAAPGKQATGLIVRNLTPNQFERVRYYEGIEYDLAAITVETDKGPDETQMAEAQIFVGKEICQSDNTAWSMDLWAEATKALSLAVMAEIAPFIGVDTIEQIDARWNIVEQRLIDEGMTAHKQGGITLNAAG